MKLLVAFLILLCGASIGADDCFFRTDMERVIFSAAQSEHVDPVLLAGVCWHETKHQPNLVHHNDGGSDSVGLCQVKVATARGLGFKVREHDLLDPSLNARVAARLLAEHLEREGSTERAVAAYNAGRVIIWNGQLVNAQYVHAVFRDSMRFANLRMNTLLAHDRM